MTRRNLFACLGLDKCQQRRARRRAVREAYRADKAIRKAAVALVKARQG